MQERGGDGPSGAPIGVATREQPERWGDAQAAQTLKLRCPGRTLPLAFFDRCPSYESEGLLL
jgi:hypothetical protein